MSDSEIEILGIFSWERPKETTSIEVFDLFWWFGLGASSGLYIYHVHIYMGLLVYENIYGEMEMILYLLDFAIACWYYSDIHLFKWKDVRKCKVDMWKNPK